ncbi:MAG: T9SS C-terminal target domain-containing protein [Verrucomicrobia bacterium]|nr:T9SS C-terminal target domain-containing protein [Verrucomicrobiota bacterium]
MAKIESALNSTSELTYNFIDKESGDNYYKLLQYDIDGNYSEWGPILAKCGKTSSAYLSAFPNPSTGKFSVVVNDKSLLGDAKIVIKDSKGSLVNIVSVKITSGINLFVIDEKLMPGLYFVNIESESKTSEVLREIIR